jgi:hypothetical protein
LTLFETDICLVPPAAGSILQEAAD